MTEQPPHGPNQPQPGWYGDPGGDQTLRRWWDGRGWTAQTQPVPQPGVGPGPVGQPPYRPDRAQAELQSWRGQLRQQPQGWLQGPLQVPPPGWQQAGQYYQGPPQYPGPQFYPAVQVIQQAGFPARVVTRRPMGMAETCFHAFMTFATGGLWGFVWWSRARMRRLYTTFR